MSAPRRRGMAPWLAWRLTCRLPAGEEGQALVESALLLATLLGALAVGGTWLMKTHPQMLSAVDSRARGHCFALSLPFP